MENTDPRYDINKHAEIVIVKPGLNGREISIAFVDTKEDWNIFTNFENYTCIDVNQHWDPAWKWIYL